MADVARFVPVAATSHRYNMAFLHVDHLNTIQKMTDADQAIVWEATYQPFGEVSIEAQPHYVNPLRFPGQYQDAETGLHQNWHRDYSPSVGRYLQSDPIGLSGGINAYGYANQNPLQFTDPDGLSPFSDCISLTIKGDANVAGCFARDAYDKAEDQVRKFPQQVLKAAEEGKCGLVCSTSCVVDTGFRVVTGLAQDEVIKRSADKYLKEVLAKWVKRGNAVNSAYEVFNIGRATVKCTTSCWTK